MFHSAHIRIPHRHRQRAGLRTFFPSSSFSPPDSRETMRKGIMFCSVAIVLLLVGCILTWLEYNNMFGGKISMTGPLLIALAVLMMLLSIRQFRLARKRNSAATNSSALQMDAMNAGGGTCLVVDQEEPVGTTTVVLEQEATEIEEVESHRVHGDVAPPSYGDATFLDCSSTCPSFISHDDRNEAPPTYEETCGIFIYGSETSLGTSVSRRGSKVEALPRSQPNTSPNLLSNQQRSINTLSPSSALLINPGTRPAILTTTSEVKEPSNTKVSCCSNVSISSEETVTKVDSAALSSPEHTVESDSLKPRDWSRRSYSSIPSYTCLLSESGEVSSCVFSPTSIISQMNHGSEPEQGQSESSPLATSSAPHRSHSASSINKLRQGVPYDLTLTTSTENAKLQLGSLSSLNHNMDSPTRRCSEGSRPNSATPIHVLHPRTDASICHVRLTQICLPAVPSIQGSFDDGDSPRQNQVVNNQPEAISISSTQHSHELLTQDIQETI